jgi:CheY-like chemotaxis protein
MIDDTESSLLVVKTTLEVTTDWTVIAVASALRGLDLAASEQPDAILLDVIMFELDGMAVFHRLKTNPLTHHIPVIFLTVKAQKTERQSLEALEPAGVITKPFEPELIANQIRCLLHWPR